LQKIKDPKIHFWEQVDKAHGPVPPALKTKCWVWTKGKYNSDGYGAASFHGKSYLAHRLAWFFTFGAWPKDNICHKCDNPLCCRPSHLFDGTDQDNVDDREKKKRGFNRNNVKLKESEVIAIRKEYALGKTSHHKLALKYGVTKPSIGYILRGQTWRHLE
jgi:hypothetical protein